MHGGLVIYIPMERAVTMMSYYSWHDITTYVQHIYLYNVLTYCTIINYYANWHA